MYSANMKVDSAELWYAGTGATPNNHVDLWSIALHEAGHMTAWVHHLDEFEYDPECATHDEFRPTMCKEYLLGTVRGRTLESHDVDTFDNAY
jgi:hypothetical protein